MLKNEIVCTYQEVNLSESEKTKTYVIEAETPEELIRKTSYFLWKLSHVGPPNIMVLKHQVELLQKLGIHVDMKNLKFRTFDSEAKPGDPDPNTQ